MQRLKFMRLKGICDLDAVQNGKLISVVNTLLICRFDAMRLKWSQTESHALDIESQPSFFARPYWMVFHFDVFFSRIQFMHKQTKTIYFSTLSNANNRLCIFYSRIFYAFVNRFHIKQITKRDITRTTRQTKRKKKSAHQNKCRKKKSPNNK